MPTVLEFFTVPFEYFFFKKDAFFASFAGGRNNDQNDLKVF